MSTPQFTPGPWRCLCGFTESGAILIDHDGEGGFICTIDPSERMEADANLIAAAPDLYAALERSLRALEFYRDAITTPSPGWREIRDAMLSTPEQTALDDTCLAIRECRAALAKARGEVTP